jgi:hypothetical protein
MEVQDLSQEDQYKNKANSTAKKKKQLQYSMFHITLHSVDLKNNLITASSQ